MDRYRRHLVSSIRLFKDRVLDLRIAKHLFPTHQRIEISHAENHECLMIFSPFLHLWIATVLAHELR